jgi:cyanophycinase
MSKHARLAILLLLATASSLSAQVRGTGTETRGSLLIVGGGTQPDELVRHFIDLAGGPERARIAVVPMASGEAQAAGDEKVEQFKSMGAHAFTMNVTREEASDARLLQRMRGVTGVWFSGGDQERLVPILRDTPLLDAIRELYAAGAVIGGTSAGAAIMPDSMITGNQILNDSLAYYGDEFGSIARGTIHIVTGFGFLPGTIIDQHFIARERHNRLMSATLERPSLIGVGIDESTALEVMPDGRWIVRGVGQAVIYDARRATLTSSDETPLGAIGIVVHVVPTGGTFDPQAGTATLP